MPHNPYWEFIQANTDVKWKLHYISYNPNITWKIVQANQDKKWHYGYLSDNINITWDIVQANPDKSWHYDYLSINPIITPKIIMENKDMFFDISYFLSNELNHHPYFQSAIYKRKMTAKMHAAIYGELIARACTPARLFQWNEGAAEQFPADYLQEYVKYS